MLGSAGNESVSVSPGQLPAEAADSPDHSALRASEIESVVMTSTKVIPDQGDLLKKIMALAVPSLGTVLIDPLVRLSRGGGIAADADDVIILPCRCR